MSSITGTQVQSTARSRFLGALMSLFATVVSFGFPAVWTIFAPTSYVSLSYDGERVSASVTHFVYLVVPYRTDRLGEVTTVTTASRAGYTSYSSTTGRRTGVQGQATLTLAGPGGEVAAMVPPENLAELKQRTEAFIASPTREGMGFLAVANWMFSVVFGALVSSIVWLLAGAAVYKLGRALWGAVRRLAGAG